MLSETRVTYNGRSGDFGVAYRQGSVYEQFIKVRQGKLEEVTSTGKKVDTWNLAGDGIFSKDKKLFGYGVRRLTYTATRKRPPTTARGSSSPPETRFHLFVYIGNTTKEEKFEDEEAYGSELVVPAGSLKFGVKVENWPFQKETNSLRYHLAVEGSGEATAGEVAAAGEDGKKKRDRLQVGGFGEVSFPREVEVKDKSGKFQVVETPALLEMPPTTGGGGGGGRNRSDVVVVFPFCTTTIRYDPDIVLTAAQEEDGRVGIARSQISLVEENEEDGTPAGTPQLYRGDQGQPLHRSTDGNVTQETSEGGGGGLEAWHIVIIVGLCALGGVGIYLLYKRGHPTNNPIEVNALMSKTNNSVEAKNRGGTIPPILKRQPGYRNLDNLVEVETALKQTPVNVITLSN